MLDNLCGPVLHELFDPLLNWQALDPMLHHPELHTSFGPVLDEPLGPVVPLLDASSACVLDRSTVPALPQLQDQFTRGVDEALARGLFELFAPAQEDALESFEPVVEELPGAPLLSIRSARKTTFLSMSSVLPAALKRLAGELFNVASLNVPSFLASAFVLRNWALGSALLNEAFTRVLADSFPPCWTTRWCRCWESRSPPGPDVVFATVPHESFALVRDESFDPLLNKLFAPWPHERLVRPWRELLVPVLEPAFATLLHHPFVPVLHEALALLLREPLVVMLNGSFPPCRRTDRGPRSQRTRSNRETSPICADRVERDAIRAVQPSAGLHIHVRVPRDVTPVHSNTPSKPLLTRDDIRSDVVSRAQHVIQRDCSLLFDLGMRVATRPTGKSPPLRIQRPPEIVATGAISSLLFARKRSANLLPLSNALALLAARAEQSLFRISSRFGTSTAYSTVYRSLITLADGQRDHVRSLAASSIKVVGLVLDNAQHFNPQWESRVGRADTMHKGVVGTAVLYEDCPPSAVDEHALRAFTQARKAGPGLLDWRSISSDIDHAFLHRTGELHWMDVAIQRCSALSEAYGVGMRELFATEGRKHQIPLSRHTVAYPLRSNAHDPALATGLKDAVLDFYAEQLGNSKEGWQPRLTFIGGDGGTFEGGLRLQKYLQVAPSPYDRLDWAFWKLEIWQTKWTASSRVYNGNFGSERSRDPSCLAHSVKAIGRKIPSNLKIDFARDTETLFIVGEARMLDRWCTLLGVDDLNEHFQQLQLEGKLPTLEELRIKARQLYRTYSCQRAYLQALKPNDKQSSSNRAPLANRSHPTSVPRAESSATTQEIAGVEDHVEAADFAGDRALANSIKFLDDFVELREWFRSTSVGEIGSTWEIVKNQIPKFAGSGHNHNYTNYCLMMYHIVEKYSPPALREAHLNNWLVNLDGRPGHFKEGDLIQEHFINRLDRHLQHKDRQYDEPFIRNVISPNLDVLNEIPRQLEESVDLKARTRRHFSRAMQVETTILTDIYRKAELHRFSAGRSLGFAAKDHHTINTLALMDPNDVPRKFKEFHANLDVFNSPQTRVPGGGQREAPEQGGGANPGAASAGNGDEAERSTQRKRTDGLEDVPINDESEEIEPAMLSTRAAVYLTDGELIIEGAATSLRNS
ncbi:hypothetical protein AURDEDRAFT_131256 [Auricularia subglabra TFB-10046 SS5]|uniref:DUF6589 domain-containing protein n=1 Tax=Auricularia subglabra (strain TFB-10046 / SS5) TaxID=717982 RepID=J0WPB9_AURST|nr:hypothetical protein AURDEDRAFT_131256 [Auricularia subglabra TFB-10046 SS5]